MENTPNTPETGTPTTPSSKTPQILGAIGALIVVGAAGVFAINKGKADTAPAPTPATDNDGGSDEAMTPGSNPDVGMTNPAANDADGGSDESGEMGSSVATTPPPTTPSTASYKDGTYSAEGDYTSPGGPESIQVTITLKGNVIADANVVSDATLNKSKFMQGQFISGYKPLVIGKNINDVSLTKVSGSSLTPIGFNDALAKIKAEASK